ncbi:beta-glucan synthesis-associated protein [Achlya hypogyna]|uniref:Beta-glucan synthesis-associated protein n=1 Tax=Achlya hypogyna TaxID=1202772 RepID=A0A1V9YQ90_ACHHY|nr:beta-glucan synthesis-associated protein [Achlya hypogyna]
MRWSAAIVAAAVVSVDADVVDGPTKSGVKTWVDVTTPEWAHTKISSRGYVYDLVMSDEFGDDSRNFTAGKDHLWTALNLPDGVNSAIGYYSPKNAYTEDGNFVIRVDEGVVPIQYWDQYSAKPGWVNKEMYYTGAMVQTWNKFCIQGGLIEVRLKLPGIMDEAAGNRRYPPWQRLTESDRGFYPTWPGIWLMGNLGRALFSASTRRMWPWTFNQCDSRYDSMQRISACNATPGHGLNPKQGRGAPEIDILEGGGNEISSSIQIGPGMPFDYRLENAEDGGCFYNKQCKTLGANMANVPSATYKGRLHWYQGLRYAANNKCAPNATFGQTFASINASVTSKKITTNTCFTSPGDLQAIPASCDVNGDLGLIDGVGPTHWNVNVNATCFAQANGYKGVYLCDPDNQYYRCQYARPDGQEKTNQMVPFNYQMDALSANWWTTQEAYLEFMNYSLEWVMGPNGHIRWSLDDQVLFEIPSTSITNVPQGGNETNPIKLPIEEPMYLIFNVATAPAWGTMPPNAGYGPCRGNRTNAGWLWKNETNHAQVVAEDKICDAFLLYLTVDYIRVWQDLRGQEENASFIGCDPPSHPTWGWILHNINEYSDANNSVIDVAGGATCNTDADCTRADMMTGICVKNRCQCTTLWGGPRCTWVADVQPDWALRAASKEKGFGPTLPITVALVVLVVLALVFIKWRQSKGHFMFFGKVRSPTPANPSRASGAEGSDVVAALNTEERQLHHATNTRSSHDNNSFLDSARYELETTPSGVTHVSFKEGFAIDEHGRRVPPQSSYHS